MSCVLGERIRGQHAYSRPDGRRMHLPWQALETRAELTSVSHRFSGTPVLKQKVFAERIWRAESRAASVRNTCAGDYGLRTEFFLTAPPIVTLDPVPSR